METESVKVKEQQQQQQEQHIEKHDLIESNEIFKTPGALLEKRKPKRAQTCKQTKKEQKRPEWTNYYAYLNDTKREKLYQVPDLPKKSKKKSKKSKNARIKSEPSTVDTKQSSKENYIEPTKPREASSSSSSSSSDESDNDNETKDKKTQRRESNSDSSKTSSSVESKKSAKTAMSTTNESSVTNLKRPKFRTTIDLDKINFDDQFNYRDDLNYQIEDALNNLHMSTTYKNLIRSMKANVSSCSSKSENKICLETIMSSRSSFPDLQSTSRKFVIHDAFYEPTSENGQYIQLRRLVRPSLPYYLFAKHHFYKFYEDNWNYYPNLPGQKCDWTILLNRKRNNSFSSNSGQNTSNQYQINDDKTLNSNLRSLTGSAKSKN